MQYTPRDILNYVYEKELDTQFLLATANHVQDFSIGEITDKKIEKRGEDFYLVSKSYHLDIKITDDEPAPWLLRLKGISPGHAARLVGILCFSKYPAEI